MMFGENRQHMQQQIAKINGIERNQPVLIALIKLSDTAIGNITSLGKINFFCAQPPVFPA